MRILVTGVTGQVGAVLVPKLKAAGTVIAANRATLDLTRLDQIADTLDHLEPDLIINPAAYTAVDKAEGEPDLARIINSKAPGVIARWATAHAVPFIHFSTDYVFNGSGDRPWHEEDAQEPLSQYGSSKLDGEFEVRAADGDHLIVRTSWVYSAKGVNFLRTIARLAREREEFRVVADQIGAPTSAALIADAMAHIATAAKMKSARAAFAETNGLIHIAATGETSRHHFATVIVAGLRQRGVKLSVKRIVPVRTDDCPGRARRPCNSRLDVTKLERVFGIRTPHWEAALAPELDEIAREMK